MLHSGLKIVLVLEYTVHNVALKVFQALHKIERRLLITFWGAFEVRKVALKLYCGVVVVDKAKGWGRVERNAGQALMSVSGIEEPVSYSSQHNRSGQASTMDLTLVYSIDDSPAHRYFFRGILTTREIFWQRAVWLSEGQAAEQAEMNKNCQKSE